MKYNEMMLERFANHHLQKFNTSLDKIRKEEGKAKKVEPWYLKYAFQNEQEDIEWHKWVSDQLKKEHPNWGEQELNIISMICAPASTYLFRKVPDGMLF